MLVNSLAEIPTLETVLSDTVSFLHHLLCQESSLWLQSKTAGACAWVGGIIRAVYPTSLYGPKVALYVDKLQCGLMYQYMGHNNIQYPQLIHRRPGVSRHYWCLSWHSAWLVQCSMFSPGVQRMGPRRKRRTTVEMCSLSPPLSLVGRIVV